MSYKVKIIDVFSQTHNVKCFRTEKPDKFSFEPGQATEVSLDKENWRDEGRPFTFTSLPGSPYLEFIIKEYPDHNGVTHELQTMKQGDHFLLSDVFGAIKYSGPGLFIAGGAGITPFISIFRKLREENQLEDNSLIFANRTRDDIILHDELKDMLGDKFVNVLSDESLKGYRNGMVSRDMIMEQLNISHGKIYLCGPPPMMEAMHKHFNTLEIAPDSIVEEEL